MSANAAPPDERVDRHLLRIAFILVLGTFMATLDATIVSVGIDRLTHEFDVSVAEIQWVTTAYLLAVVAAVPAFGWLADRFGGRRTWLAAVGVFLLGSVLCASAWSVTSFIVFRVIQGLGGGLLPATGQALLARVAGPGRTGRVISVVPLLSPVFGPVAGGSVLSVAPWPWLFLVNLPIGVVAALLARRYVPAIPPPNRRTPFDLRGALLLSPGLAVLVFGLTEVAHDRTVPATAGVSVGLAMLAAFTVHGLRTRGTPLVDPRLFARPPFGTAALAVVLQNRLSAHGPDVSAAFGDTFWWVLGFCLFAAAGATRLPRTRAGGT
ncbi:MFS transporter [Streptomyces sp. NPDC050423]|uniref:MFS transporter n=1 Tax=Streptomyces sp. NPDC050423 TaxID=3155402 RepID=UPI00342E3F87